MKNLNNNFIKINANLTLCIGSENIGGLDVKPAMIIVKKEAAKKIFSLAEIEDDVIIKHQRGGENFIGFIKLNEEWREVDLTMNHRGYVNIYNYLCDLDTYGRKVISLSNIIDKTSDPYTGDSFSVCYSDECCDYDDFLKTDIEGVYERPIYSYGVSEFDVITNSEFNALKEKYKVATITEKSDKKNVIEAVKKIISMKRRLKNGEQR